MNITRVSRSPESYDVTSARTVRASKPWKGSRRDNGECISTMPDGSTRTITRTRKRNARKQNKVIVVKHVQVLERNPHTMMVNGAEVWKG